MLKIYHGFFTLCLFGKFIFSFAFALCLLKFNIVWLFIFQENEGISDSYNVSQLLSPIITSQRVMAAQFGNTYSSMQCKDNTTIVFDEVCTKKSITKENFWLPCLTQ